VGIDDVICPDCPAEFPDWPRVVRVEGLFVGAGEEPGEERMAPTVSPRLSDTSGGSDDALFAAPGGFNERCDLPVAPFEGDQGASVENQCHSGGTPPPATGLLAGVFRTRNRAAEKPVGFGDFVVGEIAVLFLPRPHRFAEGLEPESVTGRFGQPGRHALVAICR
jgi:hypothetical protein